MSAGLGSIPHRPLRTWWVRRPPAAGAAVMATGIVSAGLQVAGHEVVSRVALVLTCVGWAGLAADFGARLPGDRESWRAQAREPVSLAAVAATTVLGTRFSALGWQSLAEALLALAALLWPVLLVDVIRTGGAACRVRCSWAAWPLRGSPCSGPCSPPRIRWRGSRTRHSCCSDSGSSCTASR